MPRAVRPRKSASRTDEVEYEEWIFGTPPQDVDFVRFVGDEVVRVETMKVDGAESRSGRKRS